MLQFSLVVAAIEAIFGLIGPAVAREHMGGAADWGYIASAFGIGTLFGGLIGMQIKPRFPMRLATTLVFFFAGVAVALSQLAPLPVIVTAALVAGSAGQVFGVLWYTTLQLRIPAHMLSRVSAYDHLGSIALAPLGIVAAGALYEAIGYRDTLLIAAATIAVPTALALCVRDVRRLEA